MRASRLALALFFTAAATAVALSGCSAASPGGTTGTAATGGSSGGGDAAASTDIDVCALLPAAAAASLSGLDIVGSTSSTIAPGQDQCAYHLSDDSIDVDVIVYQPDSGVDWDTLVQVQQGVGETTAVSGIGDQALLGSIELDVQAGNRLVAVEGAGGTLQGDPTAAKAIATAIIAKL